jgi:predicted RNase H-like HicB family nuclease
VNQRFKIIVERGQDGFLLSDVVELPGCHTQAKAYDDLIDRTKEAIALYLEMKEPELNTQFVGLQQIEIEV